MGAGEGVGKKSVEVKQHLPRQLRNCVCLRLTLQTRKLLYTNKEISIERYTESVTQKKGSGKGQCVCVCVCVCYVGRTMNTTALTKIVKLL